jgi:sn-glycerol 3-phosphate transport system substrate-binding protein
MILLFIVSKGGFMSSLKQSPFSFSWSLRPFKKVAVLLSCAFSPFAMPTEHDPHKSLLLWHSMDQKLDTLFTRLVEDYNKTLGSDDLKIVLNYRGDPKETLNALTANKDNTAHLPQVVQVEKAGTFELLALRNKNHEPIYKSFHEVMNYGYTPFKDQELLTSIRHIYRAHEPYLISFPFNVTTVVLFYNKSYFQSHNLSVPSTWEAFEGLEEKLAPHNKPVLLACESLTEHMIEQTAAWHNQPLATRGNGMDGLDSHLEMDSNFFTMHIDKLKQWYKKAWLSLKEEEEAEIAFSQGKALMLTADMSRLANLEKKVGKHFEIGVTYLPYWSHMVKEPFSTIISGSSFWTLNHLSDKQYQAIAKFYAYLLDRGVQERWHRDTGFLPITKEAYTHLS